MTKENASKKSHETEKIEDPPEFPKGLSDPAKVPKNQFVRATTADVEFLMQNFLDTEGVGGGLTGTDRRRLVGVGVRNNGFIDKAFDIARDNPNFMPANLNVSALTQNMEDLENLRQLMFVLQQFTQSVSNAFLVHADSSYRDALRIYASLQEQTRNRIEGAEPLFKALRTFFHKNRKQSGEEPTDMQIERDMKRLIHETADGELTIKNESPHMTGGLHEVIDNVHKDRSAFKATEEASAD